MDSHAEFSAVTQVGIPYQIQTAQIPGSTYGVLFVGHISFQNELFPLPDDYTTVSGLMKFWAHKKPFLDRSDGTTFRRDTQKCLPSQVASWQVRHLKRAVRPQPRPACHGQSYSMCLFFSN